MPVACSVVSKSDYGNVVPREWVNALTQYENAQCVRASRGDVIRHSNGDSYVLQSNWTRRWISNSASHNGHRGRGRALVNDVPLYYIDDLPSGSNYSTWESCRIILTHSTGGDSHYIDGSGLRRWIPNPTVYWCLRNSGTQRYWTSSRALIDTGWPEGAWATC